MACYFRCAIFIDLLSSARVTIFIDLLSSTRVTKVKVIMVDLLMFVAELAILQAERVHGDEAGGS